MQVNLTYQIGEEIKTAGWVYTVVGIEYVEGRSLRYILLYVATDGKPEWAYLHEFEIEKLKIK